MYFLVILIHRPKVVAAWMLVTAIEVHEWAPTLCSFRQAGLGTSLESPFHNRNNQQSHIINILLASFAWSVQQVMDPHFFLPCFRAWAIKGRKKLGP